MSQNLTISEFYYQVHVNKICVRARVKIHPNFSHASRLRAPI